MTMTAEELQARRIKMAAGETYEDVEKIIFKCVHRFIKQYGGDFQEQLSEANEHFMIIYLDPKFDPTLSKFTTRLTTRLWRRMLETRRNKYRIANQHSRYIALAEYISNQKSDRFDPEDFMVELSEEARLVVKLILQEPPEIIGCNGKKPNVKTMRASLKNLLLEFGWDKEKINAVFDEIRKML